jgi:hypothetical protein
MVWRTFAGLASKSTISSGETVTLGAPFLCAVAEGVAVASGVSVELGVRVSSGVAVAVGDALGVGDGETFFRFAFFSGVGLGDGVGEVFFRFGEAVGDGVGVDFLAEPFRCFRAGVGVGVAVRNFLTFLPNDSSALLGATSIPKQIAAMRRLRRTILVAGDKISGRVPVELLCSCECRLRDFREGNSRSASARGNREAPVPSGASRCPGCCETARRSGCCHLRE